MRGIARIILLTSVLVSSVSCRMFSSLLHDEKVVARLGSHMLYESEVAQLIPHGASPEDSLKIAMHYANTWAKDMIFLDIAESQLSKSEKDVTKELESYRRSLLKYKYEQLFINERLDTAVTDEEIEEYYAAHAKDFTLARPIVKARYMKIYEDSPDIAILKKKMASDDENEVWEADSLAYSAALKFSSYSGKWVDITVLAKDMELDYSTLLKARPRRFIYNTDRNGRLNIAYISDIVGASDIPPVEFCRGVIVDRILSSRKHRLVTGLEKDLLEDARAKGKFVIY